MGLVALSATAIQAVPPAFTSADGTKPWTVSATLRGFYDDNINTVQTKQSSFGFEVSPHIGGTWSPDPTLVLTGSYLFSAKYYDHKPFGNTDKWDYTHTFNAELQKAFSERYSMRVSDSFVIGQEPDVIRAGNSFSTFQRIPGDNMRNYGAINLDGQLTRLLGFEAGYANAYYNYAAHGTDFSTDPITASSSGLLDRLENIFHLDSRWTVQPETIGIVGAQFRDVNYTGDEDISVDPTGRTDFLKSDSRNFREYYGYVGADHTFNPQLTTSLRVGGRYTDFYNDPSGAGTGWGPYVNLSARWTYLPNSYFEAGLTEDIAATDLVAANNTSITSSAETFVLYGSVHHQFTQKLTGSLTGEFQNSDYNGGSYGGSSDQYYLLGVNLAYQFTPHFSSEVGYNYDKLASDVPGRPFDRNRVYIGVTAAY